VPDAVVGDLVRLRQVIVNLLGNAVKFTNEGHIRIRGSLEERRADQICLHFAVTDTGEGIPADKMDLIFSPFAQADGSATRRFGGTGLGLSISTRLVEMMGGRIWAESELGKGSTFHFTVRLGLQDAGECRLDCESFGTPLHARALIVGRDDHRLGEIADALAPLEFDLVGATTSDTGWRLLRDAVRSGAPFDLAIIDDHLVQSGAVDLIRRTRAEASLQELNVVMVGAAPPDRKLSDDARIDGWLPDTAISGQLAAHLARILRRPGSSAPIDRLRLPQLPAAQRPLSILLAEDNPVNQKLACRLLEKAGHRVTVAADGRQALSAWRAGAFDLVLMDVQMPHMDGLETTAAIRAREAAIGRHTPIVAMTAHALKGDQDRCLAAGMDGYVSKPIHLQQLLEVIEGVLPPATAA